MNKKDIKALGDFVSKYPTWWYKIGVCQLTRDFDCAPEANSPEIKYIESGLWLDECFSCDHRGSVADAIYEVMEIIEQEKRRLIK